VHDLTAARIWGIIRQLATAALVVLADKGYIGAGEHVHTPYRGTEQACLAEGRQPRPRPAALTRRARQCPAQDLAHLAQAPLLPLEGLAARQGRPCPSDPRDRTLKRITARLFRTL
jgi:hypothetical protein